MEGDKESAVPLKTCCSNLNIYQQEMFLTCGIFQKAIYYTIYLL